MERCAADGVILIIVCPRSLQALFAALRALGHRAVRRRPCTCDVLPAAVARGRRPDHRDVDLGSRAQRLIGRCEPPIVTTGSHHRESRN